jgi:hypothetical protein
MMPLVAMTSSIGCFTTCDECYCCAGAERNALQGVAGSLLRLPLDMVKRWQYNGKLIYTMAMNMVKM